MKTTISHGLKASKATPEDVQRVREFLQQLAEKVEDQENDLSEIGTFCHARFLSECGSHFERILFGFETLVENACDPNLGYLEWKPEIKSAMENSKAKETVQPIIHPSEAMRDR